MLFLGVCYLIFVLLVAGYSYDAAEDRDQNDDVGLLPMSLSGGSGGVDVAIL